MNRKTIVVLLLSLAILAGVPESFARPQYLTAFTTVYGDGSCGTCHVSASGGGPRNSYGTLFENQPNFATDPVAALQAIGAPPTATTAATSTPGQTPPPPPTATPIVTETPAETTAATTATTTGTPAAPGFGLVVSLVGLFACALLVRRHNK